MTKRSLYVLPTRELLLQIGKCLSKLLSSFMVIRNILGTVSACDIPKFELILFSAISGSSDQKIRHRQYVSIIVAYLISSHT